MDTGANVAAPFGACADDEVLEVALAAARGNVTAAFDPDRAGVATARRPDGALVVTGPRRALRAALGDDAAGDLLSRVAEFDAARSS